ncbi:hypothetical protein SCACP_05370 [Sporomusa carbonis]|uniref:cytochrome c biogenesis protein CcsA n=1 Tax=Sporomusa carbonis TaxID=3076075 RepID=UPI003A64285F
MIGYAGVALALAISIVAAGCYFLLSNRKSVGEGGRLAGTAQVLYVLSAGFIGIAAMHLFYLILGDRFEYAYVFGYSSRDLPLVYKLSAFWAGQEGSFLLWLVFHAIFGLVLLRKLAASHGVMTVYCLIQATLLIILLVKSPFMMLAEPRSDGAGLNLLLQDPWMVIHPPVVFLGYAALAVPFAYALDGLMTGCHKDWMDKAIPWTLLALSTLGAGMFIGGFWAYKVLGWGGYWAWDPVENSSLVPWLAAGASAHLLEMTRIRAGAIRMAYVGVIGSFLLVLYGTFLTRSGILSDFSTHSFADEGLGGLLGFTVLVATTVSFVLYIIKLPDMPSGELYPGIASREFVLALTALMLAFFGLLVFVGMSTPLVTMALGSAKSVSGGFYNNAALPLAVAMGAALTIGPLVKWRGADVGSLRHYWWLALSSALGLALAVWLAVLHQWLITIAVCLATAAAAAHVHAALGQRMSKAIVCSHLGVAVMLIGIMASGAGSQLTMASFIQGQSQEIFGDQVMYTGTEVDPSGKAVYNTFLVGTEKTTVQSLTKLNKEGEPAAREPGIYRRLLFDLYISPVVKTDGDAGPEVTLAKGETLVQGDVRLEFVKFNMAGMDGTSPGRVEALIKVVAGSKSQEVRPELINKNGRIIGSTVKALDRYEIHIAGIKPGEGKVIIKFKDTQAGKSAGVERLDAEVSRKPLINLVWLGAFLITVGTGWAGINKLADHARILEKGQSPGGGTSYKAQIK